MSKQNHASNDCHPESAAADEGSPGMCRTGLLRRGSHTRILAKVPRQRDETRPIAGDPFAKTGPQDDRVKIGRAH
jgi:hypothetical protein